MSTTIDGSDANGALYTSLSVPVNGDLATDTSVTTAFQTLVDNQAVLNSWFGTTGIGVPRPMRIVASSTALKNITPVANNDIAVVSGEIIPTAVYQFKSGTVATDVAPWIYGSSTATGTWYALSTGISAIGVSYGGQTGTQLVTKTTDGTVLGKIPGRVLSISSNYNGVQTTLDQSVYTSVISLTLGTANGIESGSIVKIAMDFDLRTELAGPGVLVTAPGEPTGFALINRGLSAASCISKITYSTSTDSGSTYSTESDLYDGKWTAETVILAPLSYYGRVSVHLHGKLTCGNWTNVKFYLKIKGGGVVPTAQAEATVMNKLT